MLDNVNVLITGGCGFIGHHFVEYLMRKTLCNIYVIDMLSYASFGFDRLKDNGTYYQPRVKCISYNLAHKLSEGVKKELGDINIIIHLAAETHVDNSIKDPVNVIFNNIMSTTHMLEYARELKNLQLFFYFSTDEVYGPALNNTSFKEWDCHNPTNPYSASKSGGENICLAYKNTYNIPIMIVNVMNVFGERQHSEKFIPHCIKSILEGNKILIHSYPNLTQSGTRYYIHAQNVASAVLFLIRNGKIGEKYNIAGQEEISNLDMAMKIAEILNKELKYELINFHESRPGHDLRYSLDGKKLKEMGWSPPRDFNSSLKQTILWTVENKKWL